MLKNNSINENQNAYKQIGKAPGTLIYTGDKTDKSLTIEYYDYSGNHVISDYIKNISEVINHKTTNSVTWINIDGLKHTKEIENIGIQYNIHPLVLEDIVNTAQRPKIDEYDDYIFIVLKMLYFENDSIKIEQVSFILGENYVLTFQEAEGDVFKSIRQRITENSGRIRNLKSDYLLFALVDAVVDHYFSIIEIIGEKIESLENDMFSGSASEHINIEIQQLKKEILKVRRAILPLKDILNRFINLEHNLIQKKTISYYKDIYDHLIQVTENIEIYREMIWSLMDMYMTTISNKMNEVMKVLTIIATIFIPLTFIAGLYGMNFKYMPELNYKYSYPIFWAVMFLILIIMIIYFKRKKWL